MDEEIELKIESFNDKGQGIAYFQKNEVRCKVALSNVIIDDLIKAKIGKRKHRGQYKGKLLSILKKSIYRTSPTCSHTDICGGCCFQNMKYEEQLKLKEKKVLHEFQEILKKQNVAIYPIIPCENPFYYRNKMEFSFSENGAKTKFLGLMIAGANKYVFNVDKCFIASPWVSEVLSQVKLWWEKSSLLAYNFQKDAGHLRYLTIREGKNTSEKMVVLTVSGSEKFVIDDASLNSFVEAVLSGVADKKNISIFLRTQKIEKKKATEFIERLLFGKLHITESLHINDKKLFFKISPASFFQPNTLSAEKLYTKAFELAKVDKASVVFDLYCGTGTLGMVFSHQVKNVIGIELSPNCVKDANENIKLNNIDNFKIFEGDVGKTLTLLLSKKDFTFPDLVILDPPRIGLDLLAISHMQVLKPKKILYISCNPKTQAENIKDFLKIGYSLKLLQPLDQFPHTAHIENIALLEKS